MRVLHLSPSGGSGIAAYAAEFRAAAATQGIEVVPLPDAGSALHSVSSVRRAIVDATSIAGQFDLAHAECGGGTLEPFYALAALQRRRLVRTVMTVHDAPGPVWWPYSTAAVRRHQRTFSLVDRFTSPAAREHERRVLARSGKVLCLTERGANATRRRYGLDAGKVGAIGYARRTEARTVTPVDELTVAYFGWWYRGKAIEDLIQAVGRLADTGVSVRARLWGAPSPYAGLEDGRAYVDELRELALGLGIADRIEFLGPLPAEELAAGLQSCHAVVLPYMPLPGMMATSAAMHDAFACGVPVVATAVRALDETVKHGVNGLLVAPGSVESLVAGLRALADDKELRGRLAAGAAATGARHDLAAVGPQIAAAYEVALQASRPGRRALGSLTSA